MRHDAAEQRRQKGNLIRLGTVAQVDHGAARCRVQTGELLTDWIPWLVPRAGAVIEWSAPNIGEQGILLCPDGDTSGAVFLRGLYSTAFGQPADGEAEHLIRYPDGTQIHYDASAHALTAILASGGTATITTNGGVTVNASGGITVNGDVQVNGKLTASDDVLGGGISLKNHTHGGVQSGSSSTDKPQ